MEAIILAGGRGSRLQSVVSDVPKPMAPIGGRPFLEILLEDLETKGIRHVVLAVGYKKEQIISHFGQKYRSIEIEYSSEDEPLGTGGAIRKALERCGKNHVFVVNGDTFFDFDYMEMYRFAERIQAPLVVAVREMSCFSRYGSLDVQNGRIVGYKEKQFCEKGIINGGIYLMRREILSCVQQESFSFEKDFMEKYYRNLKIPVFFCNGYFIDIGVPEDYARAKKEWRHLVRRYDEHSFQN